MVVMVCNQKAKCDYFQWANKYLSDRNKAWKEQRLRERGNPLCGFASKMALAKAGRPSHWVYNGQPLIQMTEHDNTIVSQPELRGVRSNTDYLVC